MSEAQYFNRELSWLAFNGRVLEEARDPAVPLLERVKFLAITGSNLDEFFMVRVGSLKFLHKEGRRKRDPSGLTPLQQLQAIGTGVRAMIREQYDCLREALLPPMEAAGIRRLQPAGVSEAQRLHLQRYFDEVVFPVLTPMGLALDETLPLLMQRQLYLLVRMAPGAAESEAPLFSVIPLGEALGRFVTLPGEGSYDYVFLEDLVAQYVQRFFPGRRVLATAAFRITRNADMSVEDDLAFDLMSEMEDLLAKRKRSDVVRLELAAGADAEVRAFLQEFLRVEEGDVYDIDGPLDLTPLMQLGRLAGFEALKEEPWPPLGAPRVDPTARMFDVIAKSDVLLFHPQQSFEPVLRFINEAADDPDVLAIKQILYRTSKQSPIVAALARAAEKGKYVTVIVELKARFDEARNIEWARALEMAGVQVIYGIKGLKTHAKCCIVVRREPEGLRRYVHFGTGNYNEVTAHLYTDISYLTSNVDLGADASAFFNTVTGYTQPERYLRLSQSPRGIRESLLGLIDAEAERKRQGQPAMIMAKMNSLVDPAIIQALYRASQDGVEIRLNVRGICCLRPGVPGLSENIEVISIVDRFLEHDRILYFRHGGDELTFISSADWMPRNLDRRIELLVPVVDRECCQLLIRLLRARFHDNAKARRLMPDGTYERLAPKGRRASVRSQKAVYGIARELFDAATKNKPTVFEPHRSPMPARS